MFFSFALLSLYFLPKNIAKLTNDVAEIKTNVAKNTTRLDKLEEQRRIDSLNIAKILEVQVKGTYSA